MGLRFFRRAHIAPGVDLNLSRSGASVSVGERGAHVTVGPRGTRETVGLPGTGLSYTQIHSRKTKTAKQQKPIGITHALVVSFALLVVFSLAGVHASWVAPVCLGIGVAAFIGSRLPSKPS